ncbi:DUF3141 domain-containing protein [Bacillus sp. CGMCC 1.16541]|uniref:DUF3141 domain-containing protein n=1 Tax=Bacillus sp. CGMCC 1.16541 TaxID=2185143 RepID=UPI000D73D328|nr:DUF3141 domain-containing protein [Bacillus sp. CGMCC 1.16541]
MPASFIEAGVRLVTSPFYFTPYLSLLNRIDDQEYVQKWRRFHDWTKGHIPFVGATLKQLLNDLVKENKLVKGQMVIRNQRIDLRNISSNLLVISSKNDRLVPKEQTYLIMNLVSSEDKQYVLNDGGHTSITVKNGQLPEYLKGWLQARSDSM